MHWSRPHSIGALTFVAWLATSVAAGCSGEEDGGDPQPIAVAPDADPPALDQGFAADLGVPPDVAPDATRPDGPYVDGAILPSLDRATLDAAVLAEWKAWKARYLVEGCTPGRVYADVSADGAVGGGKVARSITVSELHGFAMLLTALMADRDPDARRLFDGLLAFFRDHPSWKSPDLMAWNQVEGCRDSPKGTTSATDGDLDIAHALLIAARRWGDRGPVDYAAEARRVIAAIKAWEMDPVTRLVTLGDFVRPGEGKHGTVTRTSDFMIDHFRAFARATSDPFWEQAVDAHWSLVERLQERFSPRAGLVPDFVIDTRTDPRPPPGKWLESPNDPHFAWNACRVPWRLGTDFLVSGDPRARAALARLNAWIRAVTGDDPRKIDGGYRLDGAGITPTVANEIAFVAPFGVAAMSDARNQAWLDAIWAHAEATPIEADDYYGNSIKLLSMIVMSGRWIAP